MSSTFFFQMADTLHNLKMSRQLVILHANYILLLYFSYSLATIAIRLWIPSATVSHGQEMEALMPSF